MNLKIKRFEFGKDENSWNFFLLNAKNTTFLFNRKFMDYHKHIYKDHSIIIFNKKNNIIACFPANQIDEKTISSHSGLTYGAFIFAYKLKLPVIIEVYKEILKYYYENGFENIIYKAFPRIYNKIPSDEIDYCLFLSDAKLWRKDTTLVIDQINPIKFAGNIKREARKAKDAGIKIEEKITFKNFWENVLTPNLMQKYGAKPLHTYSQIELLKNNFPTKIKLFVATNKEEKILAGVVIFETELVAHCQYISATYEGRKSGALNYLFIELITNIYKNKRYFDFGIVNEKDGKRINTGLLAWKERMGGRTVSHDFFKILTKNHYKLNVGIL